MTLVNRLHGLHDFASSRTGRYIARLIFVAYLAAVALFAYVRPYYNWDLIGYVGAVTKITESDPVKVHEEAYRIVKAATPDSVYALLTTPADPYRNLMAQDPWQFALQLRLICIVVVIHLTQKQYVWDTMPYARGMVATIRQLLLNDLFLGLPSFVGFGIVTIVVAGRTIGRDSYPALLSIVALASMFVRILLFPHLADRFFPVEYVLTGIAFLVTIGQVMMMTGQAAANRSAG